ncbi:MAG: pyruvoyl-dependent arginine decarboxylase [Thermoleophilia bacterium]
MPLDPNDAPAADGAPAAGPPIPTKVFLTSGVGVARRKLTSFEFALRQAGIERCNLVRVSSIFPPHCELISREEGIALIRPGAITFCVVAEFSTDEPHRRIASSIGLALPRDRDMYGYLSEHESFGQTADEAGDVAEDLAASMLASTLGVECDENVRWDDRRRQLVIEGQIFSTTNVTVAAAGDLEGRWTTTVAAAVFVGF